MKKITARKKKNLFYVSRFPRLKKKKKPEIYIFSSTTRKTLRIFGFGRQKKQRLHSGEKTTKVENLQPMT